MVARFWPRSFLSVAAVQIKDSLRRKRLGKVRLQPNSASIVPIPMDNGHGSVCRRERPNNGAGMIMDEELDLLEHPFHPTNYHRGREAPARIIARRSAVNKSP